MTRILKTIICLALGLVAASNTFGFSMWGPLESWQTQSLDYIDRYLPFFPLPNESLFEVEGPGSLGVLNVELGGTKNLGEGSRLNTPIITYAYDSTFLNYFGTKGVAAIDSAFAVINNLPSASASSSKFTGFVTQGNQQVNYTAQALRMLDLKSTVMWLLIEHMGLIGETHTYDLRGRVAEAGATNPCSFFYTVINRNFDPVTYNPSEYVNGTLLSYQIGDLCPAFSVGDAMEESAQVGVPPFSSVATREALQVGGYYLRITRDDMGGLKYLYNPGRYVYEGIDSNAVVASSIVGYNPINLTNSAVSNAPGTFAGLLGGVNKITFVKTPYNSLLGTSFSPIKYHYTIPWVTNGVLRSLGVTRTIRQPDIIFTAGDLSSPAGASPPYQITLERNGDSGSGSFITYGEALTPGSINGEATTTVPAVIAPQLIVTLNDTGQVTYNLGTQFADQNNAIGLGFTWGWFNGSTNAPIPFPTGSSLAAIEGQVFTAGPETQLNVFNPVVDNTNTTTTGASTVASP